MKIELTVPITNMVLWNIIKSKIRTGKLESWQVVAAFDKLPPLQKYQFSKLPNSKISRF